MVRAVAVPSYPRNRQHQMQLIQMLCQIFLIMGWWQLARQMAPAILLAIRAAAVVAAAVQPVVVTIIIYQLFRIKMDWCNK